MIKVTKQKIDGLYVIEPEVHNDERGSFIEIYNQRELQDAGFAPVFVQDNLSISKKGVLRGLHFQKKYPQAKLIRVIEGVVFDVAVDVRPDSATYGQWFGIVLSAENNKQFYISEGFAHGFYVLSDVAQLCYKVTSHWNENDQIGIPWNDPDIGIEWPLLEGKMPLIADKDKIYASFASLEW